jgi:ATP:ADP antiporter, AAA family
MSQDTTASFGKIRSVFWPVHAFELKKLLPMLIMAFCISFNYTVLRDTKDTLIVTSVSSEAIPFLKLWGVVPAAIVFMLIYAKLSNILSKETLFYVTIAPFIVFFGLFAFVIYPNHELLHPTATANYLSSVLPQGFAGLIGCFENWTFSVFYILSELWGSAVLSLMFWGFANEIVKTMEAKRFYTLFTLGFNVALMVSGPMIIYFSRMGKNVAPGVDPWQTSLNYLMSMFMVSAIVIVVSYWWMNRNVLNDKRFYDPEEGGKKKKSKPKLSVAESLKFLAGSKYIRSIAMLVIGYGMCINLVEVVWKGQLKIQFPNPNDYSAFMGLFSTITGLITICMTFVGGYIIRKKGWGKAAIMTPLALLITGTAFFAFVVFREYALSYIAFLGTTPVFMAVIIGMVQNIASKSTKYSLFDPTKEMAYIPLDQESKVKGKAAIDVVGARLGKSGGALLFSVLFLTVGNLAAITPVVAVVMILVIFVWIASVKSLSTQYTELTGEREAESKPAGEAVTAKA